jgi:hypothetical protein
MLSPLRRHVKSCGHSGRWDVECPPNTKLKCPLIVARYEIGPSGRKNRKEQSLGTNDETVAWQLINQMVVSGDSKPAEPPRTVKQCIDGFLDLSTAWSKEIVEVPKPACSMPLPERSCHDQRENLRPTAPPGTDQNWSGGRTAAQVGPRPNSVTGSACWPAAPAADRTGLPTSTSEYELQTQLQIAAIRG